MQMSMLFDNKSSWYWRYKNGL